ncbi:hypothetical protein SCATT_49680 [Streptantibioticus cattleyicolor NRRL 8057 = DSM 46488]|uniref:Uncharacterized protein n=1 Tax=Streptantibioticus cattleyicolor (strain ATCC 35852 / DSM 46488 / JCM 4925 / NBRC 14057 / NRRL 8057) TaxID=1003195 RepID=G8X0V0_STREN|nr:hypothetical protein SCATT_49680 [Streptantibioticus cattleyicolor NRRL 8057 = DSM 46488]
MPRTRPPGCGAGARSPLGAAQPPVAAALFTARRTRGMLTAWRTRCGTGFTSTCRGSPRPCVGPGDSERQ